MPTYKNQGTEDAALGGTRLSPNEELQTIVVHESLPTGVVKTAEAPIWNPVLASSNESGGIGVKKSLAIPAGESQYEIEVNCVAGSVEVRFNVSTGAPIITLTLNDPVWKVRCLQRMVEVVYLEFVAGASEVHTVVLQR